MVGYKVTQLSATNLNTRWERGKVIYNGFEKLTSEILTYWNIHSVLRESDGVIFTVGDIINTYGKINLIKRNSIFRNLEICVGDTPVCQNLDSIPKHYHEDYQDQLVCQPQLNMYMLAQSHQKPEWKPNRKLLLLLC